jgi:hypothetical protein
MRAPLGSNALALAVLSDKQRATAVKLPLTQFLDTAFNSLLCARVITSQQLVATADAVCSSLQQAYYRSTALSDEQLAATTSMTAAAVALAGTAAQTQTVALWTQLLQLLVLLLLMLQLLMLLVMSAQVRVGAVLHLQKLVIEVNGGV